MKGFRATHGTHEYFRHGGSIGTNMTPGRTLPGKKMPGQHGNTRSTMQNLKVVRVIADQNLVLIEGAVPGAAEGIVTVRGASVGDHDLVRAAAEALGLDLKVASVNVRPGKPTFFGTLADGRRMLGLPGNPASAFVCAELFLRPILARFQGAATGPAPISARLAQPLSANGPREHWMRAKLTHEGGALIAEPYRDQDSSLVTVFAAANALLRRPAGAPASNAGDLVEVLPLPRA